MCYNIQQSVVIGLDRSGPSGTMSVFVRQGQRNLRILRFPRANPAPKCQTRVGSRFSSLHGPVTFRPRDEQFRCP